MGSFVRELSLLSQTLISLCCYMCVDTNQPNQIHFCLLDGASTIIQDERFVVRHGLLKEDDWALQIKNLDKSDAGLYQCQTNSDPVQSQYYQLNVVGRLLFISISEASLLFDSDSGSATNIN